MGVRRRRQGAGAAQGAPRLRDGPPRPTELQVMHLTLHIWRLRGSGLPGGFVRYAMTDVSPDMSFLEMLDVLNQQLLARKAAPIAFDHDCRAGFCGSCGLVSNAGPQWPPGATTT